MPQPPNNFGVCRLPLKESHKVMNQSRTHRIHRGVHRTGAVLVGVIFTLGLAYAFAEPLSFRADAAGFAFGFPVAAAVVCALSRAIGWNIAGFAGD